MADFYAARDNTTPPLPWPSIAPPFTTWHEDETLEEAVEFAKHCTKYSEVNLEDILVLDFAHHERSDLIKEFYLAA